jgi:hypothetical protein
MYSLCRVSNEVRGQTQCLVLPQIIVQLLDPAVSQFECIRSQYEAQRRVRHVRKGKDGIGGPIGVPDLLPVKSR